MSYRTPKDHPSGVTIPYKMKPTELPRYENIRGVRIEHSGGIPERHRAIVKAGGRTTKTDWVDTIDEAVAAGYKAQQEPEPPSLFEGKP